MTSVRIIKGTNAYAVITTDTNASMDVLLAPDLSPAESLQRSATEERLRAIEAMQRAARMEEAAMLLQTNTGLSLAAHVQEVTAEELADFIMNDSPICQSHLWVIRNEADEAMRYKMLKALVRGDGWIDFKHHKGPHTCTPTILQQAQDIIDDRLKKEPK